MPGQTVVGFLCGNIFKTAAGGVLKMCSNGKRVDAMGSRRVGDGL